MYCSNCGQEINTEMKYCPSCGEPLNEPSRDYNRDTSIINNASLGYSNKISDPLFKKYVKNTNRYAMIFSFIIAIIAIVGFYIAGETSSDMDNPDSLFIGLAIGSMFLLIGFIRVIGKKRSKTWDGTVVDKSITQKKRKISSGSDTKDFYWQNYMEYVVVIQSHKGKKHNLISEDDQTVYNYYHVGDKVRHHGGLDTFEKYDKTNDSIVFCNACATLCDITMDHCPRCKCPLLK